ncbi:MAG: response regulator transcription factor [Chthoniobacteraceae bacterium]
MAAPDKNPETALTRVVLVDDHVSVREMLRVVLGIEGGYEIVGEATGGIEALKVCRATRPALVVLDLALPELSGTHLLRLLQRESWDVRVLVYTGATDQQMMREALAESPHGFVRKEDSLAELRTALKAVVTGARHLSPWTSRLLPQKADEAMRKLTATERAILHMVAEGLQTKEIADAMGSTVKTVEHHRQHLRDKLGLHDAVGLTRFAMQQRLLSP